MHVIMLKARLRHAEVIHAILDYEGSYIIDGDWLDLSGIHKCEQIQIYNVDNDECFTAYTIRAKNGSKMISVNDAAAHKAKVGDRVIVYTCTHYSKTGLANYRPYMLYVASGNQLSHTSEAIPIQVT